MTPRPLPDTQARGVERIGECARAVDEASTRDEWYEILVAARGEAIRNRSLDTTSVGATRQAELRDTAGRRRYAEDTFRPESPAPARNAAR